MTFGRGILGCNSWVGLNGFGRAHAAVKWKRAIQGSPVRYRFAPLTTFFLIASRRFEGACPYISTLPVPTLLPLALSNSASRLPVIDRRTGVSTG